MHHADPRRGRKRLSAALAYTQRLALQSPSQLAELQRYCHTYPHEAPPYTCNAVATYLLRCGALRSVRWQVTEF